MQFTRPARQREQPRWQYCGLGLLVALASACGTADANTQVAASLGDDVPLELLPAITTTSVVPATTLQILSAIDSNFTEISPTPVDSRAPGANSRFLEPELTWWENPPIPNYFEFGSVLEFADNSTIVVVGRLIGTSASVQSLGSLGPDGKESPGSRVEYDGIEFLVEDVLVGDIDPNVVITVAVPAVALSDESAAKRVWTPFLPKLEEGLRDLAAEHRYLIFGTVREGWAPIYEFLTPAGVSQISASGEIESLWPSSPLSSRPWHLDEIRKELGTRESAAEQTDS